MPIKKASQVREEKGCHAILPEPQLNNSLPGPEALEASGSFSTVLFHDDDHKEYCVRMSYYFVGVRKGWERYVHEDRVLHLQFVMKGDLHVQPDGREEQVIPEGQYVLYHPSSARQVNWFNPANSHTTTLDIYFTPKYLKRQAGAQKIRKVLDNPGNKDGAAVWQDPANITPDIKAILHAIIHCSYTGELRKMYIHCKLTELLVIVLERIAMQPVETELIHLKQYDVEKLRESRTYLMEHMEDPPTLKQLAHKVGINDFKLKKGYKQLFGTTIFGDFQRVRMAKAREFLFEGGKSIVEIALLCGYRDASNFSRAFKDYFGVPPGRMQRHARAIPQEHE
ncbi:MAG: AraC family transcriptional regulator [Bacteroidota bacterium]|nr:AraC family transcriptional regulator [Bacteroidota bacterium]MDP4214841.1 AraC family transcriptional regulator [Bacteroidota bacterium]MDP4247728.1 AraC family transcriptional regulator [Bacteroidota bacterium]MDP4256232.1 AraC family transcriptional regulator [Bacteroidota bacterium]MDP4259039.1 AraC family transcriptional regulator [Bacteroidota bacterium]